MMNFVRTLFGGPRPPLQPTGPAPFAQPNERDRRALFWWLKRNTSYTVRKHNAALWTIFIGEFETWLRSVEDPGEHLVTTLKYAIDTQLYYERGLERLQRGDRSVFSSTSSEGWFRKVNTALVDSRMEWYVADPIVIAEQDGIPLSMLRAYYAGHNAAMSVGRTTSYRGMGFPEGSARSVLDALPFDTTLPEPRWDVSFKPGDHAPKDGIYEMVNGDGHIVGSLEHLIKGQKARSDDFIEFGPDAFNEHSSAFNWRLIWEDARYKDGKIPDEENSYPMPEGTDQPVPTAEPVRLRCEAGQPCPREGWWFAPAKPDSRRHFVQGEVMPAFSTDYGATIWQWNERRA